MRVIALLALLSLLFGCSESPQETQALYTAWKHANPKYESLTFDDWYTLREHEMLPGVDYATIYAKRAKDSADSAVTISVASMAASSSPGGSKK